MQVPFVSFLPMERELEKDIRGAFDRVFTRSWYIEGKEKEEFETSFAEYCNVKYCVGVGNGLDALMLALKALNIGVGDEVIVPSNTYIATALAVTYVGAKPILVEPDIKTFNIDVNYKDGKYKGESNIDFGRNNVDSYNCSYIVVKTTGKYKAK